MLLALIQILLILLTVAWWIIVIQMVLSWLVAFNVINTHNDFVRGLMRGLDRILEPIYRPIRKVLPDFGGLDFSPMVVIIVLLILQRLHGSELLEPLLGFNLGLEVAQLAALALILGPLWLLARSRTATLVLAITVGVVAASWVAQRALDAPNPLDPVVTAVLSSPERLAMVLLAAGLVTVATGVSRSRAAVSLLHASGDGEPRAALTATGGTPTSS